ncbi:MAG: hypothetical protein HQ492_02480 [Woeseiaceae bacterium]|nr:hypothetical protein [Woeseiaceae bacterium]
MNILSLFPKAMYDTNMCIDRSIYLNWVGRSDTVVWSGPGWGNYEDGLSVQDNAELIGHRLDCEFDVIVFSGKDEYRMPSETKAARVLIYNEAHDVERVMLRTRIFKPDLSLFHHHGDFKQWGGLGVNPIFHCSPIPPETEWGDRKVRVILTGSTERSVYPLRNSAEKAISQKMIRGGFTRRHPGYRLRNRAEINAQFIDYLKALSGAKVSICCSSIYKYPLAKMIESAACGCVVATDKPYCDRFEELLWPHCIQLDAGMSSEEIADVINGHSDEELTAMSAASREVAANHYSLDNWAACFLAATQGVVK